MELRDQVCVHQTEEEAWAVGPADEAVYALDQEYLACVRDILGSSVFESMDQFIQHGNTTCKEHCIQVSYRSYLLCRRFGWEYRQAARAGLLHDLFLYDWHTHAKETGEHFHGFTHPRKALENAVRYFELTDVEKDIILRHMWPLTPIPPRSRQGMAIIYADKLCSLIEMWLRVRNWLAASFRAGRMA